MIAARDYDPSDPAVRRDPHPYYAALRREAPVFRIPSSGLIAISRYEDVLAVLRQTTRFSSHAMDTAVNRTNAYSPIEESTPAAENRTVSIIGMDPPEHARLRDIVTRGFTPGRIAILEPRIRKIARELAEGLPRGEAFDLMQTFAVPLPVTVIAELLGIDPALRTDFKRWSDAMVRAVFDTPEGDEALEVTRCIGEMAAYFDSVIAERERKPREDLISLLLRAEAEQGALSREEARTFAFTLMVAGSVTTTNLIGNGWLALLRHPEQLRKLRSNPALVPGLVEETLRYDAPVHIALRTATEDAELRGGKIPAGSVVAPLLASANRDAAVFEDPDRFDVSRRPRGHLAFGHGVHFCLGAALARLEARVAFESLLEIADAPSLVDEDVAWINPMTLRGPKQLIVSSGNSQ